MIYLLASQGIGVEWGGKRGISPQDYRVLSNPRHVQGCRPTLERDRVIEVGPGPSSPDVRREVELSFSGDWIEWEPMIPALASELAPPRKKINGMTIYECSAVDQEKWFMASKQDILNALFKDFFPINHSFGVIKDVT